MKSSIKNLVLSFLFIFGCGKSIEKGIDATGKVDVTDSSKINENFSPSVASRIRLDEVPFADPVFKQCVISFVHNNAPSAIYADEVKYVGCQNVAVTNLSGLENLINLRTLGLWGTSITDLSPISSMPNLTYMGLTGNLHLTDLTPLQNLTSLRSLIVPSVNRLLAQVGTLNQLQHLTVETENGFVNDYPPDLHLLSNLKNLIQLHLENLNLQDLGGLEFLTNLNFLHLSNNRRINNIIPLFSLANLSYVELYSNDQIPCAQLEYFSRINPNTTLYGLDQCVPEDGGPTPDDPSPVLR